MVNPAFVTDVVPQADRFVNPAQDPPYNCSWGFVMLAPRLLKVMVSVVAAATKEYQTS
jgi:hypothetical protein